MDTQALEAARAVASRFIGYAARSRAEVVRRLERDEVAPEIIERVVGELEAQGWLDDAQFAQNWVADRADRKRYGRTRLAAELRNRGVEKEATEAALGEVTEEEELERARAAARPRWRFDAAEGADAGALPAEKRKIANYLQRRGFSWHIITQVLAELTENRE